MLDKLFKLSAAFALLTTLEGFFVGRLDGFLVGFFVGLLDGFLVGFVVGLLDGFDEGFLDGFLVGDLETRLDGLAEGFLVGRDVGFLLGRDEGIAVRQPGYGERGKNPLLPSNMKSLLTTFLVSQQTAWLNDNAFWNIWLMLVTRLVFQGDTLSLKEDAPENMLCMS
jgi:hypothetical protein